MKKTKVKQSPRILYIDIETAPMLVYAWGLFDQNHGLNQIKDDWHMLSFACKWADSKEVFYFDQSKAKDIEKDKPLLEKLWVYLNEADIVIGQNVKSFDHKKINARFLTHGMTPPSSYRMIDTLTIMKKNFKLTSNKLEYATDLLNTKYKKLKHNKYPGFALWSACLKGDKEAWKEMEKYNKYDILSLEELYQKLAPWDNSINFNVYHSEDSHICSCGSKEHKLNGFRYTNAGKFQRFVCKKCGKESQSKHNELYVEKKRSMNK